MKFMRVLAVDPSLTCSGWACFHLTSGKVMGIGKVRAIGPGIPLAMRLADLYQKVSGLLGRMELSSDDVVVCEAPTTMRDPHNAIKVEQVRCIFEDVARERGALVPGRINPRSVHFEVMGLRGKQLPREEIKAIAVECARARYGDTLEKLGFDTSAAGLKKHQDIVDALLIGTLAVGRMSAANVGGIAPQHFFESTATPRTRGAA